MKSISKYLLFIIATLSFFACSPDEENKPTPGPGPNPSNDYVTVTKEAKILETGSTTEKPVTITVTANGDWTASVNASWLSINPSNGNKNTNTISLTAGENTTGKERVATITVKCGTQSDVCTVTQKAIDNISVNNESLTFDATESIQTITLTSNVDWSVRTEVLEKWCHLSAESGGANENGVKIEVKVDDNTTEGSRDCNIIFSDKNNDNNRATVTVTQKAGERPTISKFQRDEKSGKFSVSYNSIFPVEIVGICYSTDKDEPNYSDNKIEREVNPGSKSGSAEFTISNPPDKSYHVRAFAKNAVGLGYSSTINVTVEDEELDVDTDSIIFDPEGSIEKFKITSNVSWTIDAPQWCTLSVKEGDKSRDVTVEAKRNDTKKVRDGKITVTSKTSGTERIILVSQEAAKLKPGEDDNKPPQTVRKK